jgi:co-chaperonin GroES (HSP10)
MAGNFNKVFNGDLKPIHDRVIVNNMHFGEQKTESGLIIGDDNGTTRGVYARWGQVYAKGDTNTDSYNIGDWILVEHGRWTRGLNVDNGTGATEVRMVDPDAIIGWQENKPTGLTFGKEYKDGEGATFDPQDFVRV